MSVRTAELVMAIAMAIASLGIMWKASELSIGWIPRRGPGSGMWPFWLSAIMFVCCVATIVRWFLQATPESRNYDPFVSQRSLIVVGITVFALASLLVGIRYFGIYIALLAFMLFYVRVMGGHSWVMTLSLTFGVPIGVFLLFEWALTIPLPKGRWIPEEWYYPMYDFMYSF